MARRWFKSRLRTLKFLSPKTDTTGSSELVPPGETLAPRIGAQPLPRTGRRPSSKASCVPSCARLVRSVRHATPTRSRRGAGVWAASVRTGCGRSPCSGTAGRRACRARYYSARTLTITKARGGWVLAIHSAIDAEAHAHTRAISAALDRSRSETREAHGFRQDHLLGQHAEVALRLLEDRALRPLSVRIPMSSTTSTSCQPRVAATRSIASRCAASPPPLVPFLDRHPAVAHQVEEVARGGDDARTPAISRR